MSVRLPADWMQAADDRLLEYLEANSASSISTIDESEKIVYHYNTIGRRLRKLPELGLVEKIGQGVYRISGEGREYLKGFEICGSWRNRDSRVQISHPIKNE